MLATCAVGFAVLFSIVAAFTYANIFLAAPPYGLGPAQLGTVFVVYLLGAVATPTAARLTVTLGRRRMVVLAFAVVVAGLGLTLVAPLTLIVLGPRPDRHRRADGADHLHRLRRRRRRERALDCGWPLRDLLLHRGQPWRGGARVDLVACGLARLRGARPARAGGGHRGHLAGLAAQPGYTLTRAVPREA